VSFSVIPDQKNWIPADSCRDRLRDRLFVIEDPTPSSSSTSLIEDPEAFVFSLPLTGRTTAAGFLLSQE